MKQHSWVFFTFIYNRDSIFKNKKVTHLLKIPWKLTSSDIWEWTWVDCHPHPAWFLQASYTHRTTASAGSTKLYYTRVPLPLKLSFPQWINYCNCRTLKICHTMLYLKVLPWQLIVYFKYHLFSTIYLAAWTAGAETETQRAWQAPPSPYCQLVWPAGLAQCC